MLFTYCSFEVRVQLQLLIILGAFHTADVLLLSVCQSIITSQGVALLQARQRNPHNSLSLRHSPPVFSPYQQDK